MGHELVAPGVFWIKDAWTNKLTVKDLNTGLTWTINKVIRERQEAEPWSPIGMLPSSSIAPFAFSITLIEMTNVFLASRFTKLTAECKPIDEGHSSERATGTFIVQVPSLQSTLSLEEQSCISKEEMYTSERTRYSMMQYANSEEYRRMALQMRIANPLKFRAQAEPLKQNLVEYMLLRDFEGDSLAMPQLIFGGKWAQKEGCWIPGGSVYYFLTAPIPGKPLHTLWPTMTTNQRRIVTWRARDAFKELIKCGVLVFSTSKKDINFDEDELRCIFNDPFTMARYYHESESVDIGWFSEDWGLEHITEEMGKALEEEMEKEKGKEKEKEPEKEETKKENVPLRPPTSGKSPSRPPIESKGTLGEVQNIRRG